VEMKASLPFYFKTLFLAGITLLFVSLFVDWYLFQVFENDILVASWNYNILFEWSTEFPRGISINENNRPDNLAVSPILSFLFLGVAVFTIYTIFFRDLERFEDLNGLKRYSLGFLCLLALVLFYIVIFPAVYLVPNELYFPSLLYNDLDFDMRFSYSISYGYILQIVGFLLVFPFSVHYYLTIIQFERQENTPEKRIAAYIENIQESIDFDKYIAEEEALS
jgi:hypothetical protein